MKKFISFQIKPTVRECINWFETETNVLGVFAMLRAEDFKIVGIGSNDQWSKLSIIKCFENIRCSCKTIVNINLYTTFCLTRTRIFCSFALCFTRYVIRNESNSLVCVRSKCQRLWKIYNYRMRTYRTDTQKSWRLDDLFVAYTKSCHKEVTRCIDRHHTNISDAQDILK